MTLGYNDASQLTSLSRQATGGGPTIDTAFGYDLAGRLTDIDHTSSLAGALSSFDYDYDFAGRLTDYSGPEGSLSYAYDNTDQLVGVSGSRSEDYGYDLGGNRNTTGYQTGGNNQLLSDGTFTYSYDDEGNRKTKTRISDGQVWEYTWDHRNRLVQVVEKTSGGTVVKQVDYTYDVWDRRIGVSVDPDGAGPQSATDTWTVYDGANPYADFDDSGSLTTRYLYGPAVDFLLARVDSTGDEDWYLTDNLGSVRQIVDSDGTVLDAIDYDSYGNILSETNPTAGDRFKYTAREWDAAVDLYFYRARYYDPSTGRFISEDPIGFSAGEGNLSRYVHNSATYQVDPSGLFGEDWRLPVTGGKWESGTPGNGVWVTDGGIRVEFTDGVPNFDPYVAKVNGEKAEVEIEVSGNQKTDSRRADAEMRKKNRAWKKPERHVWHHAGPPGSKKMQLVPEEVNRIAHRGTASQARQLKLKAMPPVAGSRNATEMKARGRVGRATNALGIIADGVGIVGDARERAPVDGYGPGSYFIEAPWYFADERGKFVVVTIPGRWPPFSKNKYYKVYLNEDGSMGQSVQINRDEFEELRAEGRRRWGYKRFNWLKFRWEFVPGTERKSLPVIRDRPFRNCA